MALVVFGIGSLLWLARPAQHTVRFGGIEIRGTKDFKDHVVNALSLLMTKAPDAYCTVTNYIGAIVQSAHTGMAAYERPATSYLHDKVPWVSPEAFASSIAHESFHSKLYLDKVKELGPSAPVPDEVWSGEGAEKLCCEYQAGVLQKIGGTQFEISYYGWDPARDPTNRYWEIPYEKREW
jgi:hypothetical protein